MENRRWTLRYEIDVWAETASEAATEATITARTASQATWSYTSDEDDDGRPMPPISGQVDVTIDFTAADSPSVEGS